MILCGDSPNSGLNARDELLVELGIDIDIIESPSNVVYSIEHGIPGIFEKSHKFDVIPIDYRVG